MTDAEREVEIDNARLALLHTTTTAGQRAAWDRLVALIHGRSPEQVRRMEREQGLRQ